MIMHISTIKSFDTNINHQVIILIITKALRIKSLDSNLPVNLFFFVLCETNDYCGSISPFGGTYGSSLECNGSIVRRVMSCKHVCEGTGVNAFASL